MAEGPPVKKQYNPPNGDHAPTVIIMVTGGKGLVGRALEDVVKNDPNPNEHWVFLSSADGDLWYNDIIMNMTAHNYNYDITYNDL